MTNFVEKKEIENTHKKLILELKNKIKKYNSKKFKPDYDLPVYFSIFYNGAGLEQVLKIIKKKNNIFIFWYNIFKDFFFSLNFTKFKILNLQKLHAKKIIVTWGQKKNFNLDGSFNDVYFNVNSNKIKKDIQWIVLYQDDELPVKVNGNILLIKVINKKKFNFFVLFIFLISKLKYLFIDFTYFLFSISSHNFFSEQISKVISNIISDTNKFFLFPYEAQPFQNRIISELKNKNIKTIGYVHYAPHALPINLIKKKNSPTSLFVNGINQKECFMRLGWRANQIHLINSSRFLSKKKNLSNQIFLPLSIKFFNVILVSLKYLFENFDLNTRKLKIKNHPASHKSLLHLKLMAEIKNLLIKDQQNLKKNGKKLKNYSIFIGTSGAIIEALVRGVRVIHISEAPIIDSYFNFLWKNVVIKKIANNIFTYKIKKKSDMIMLGNKLNNLNMYFKNL